jgi:hypothetical protein
MVLTIFALENDDTMGERIGRIGRIDTDFYGARMLGIREKSKKIRVNPPDPPNPFSHRIIIFQSINDCFSYK